MERRMSWKGLLARCIGTGPRAGPGPAPPAPAPETGNGNLSYCAIFCYRLVLPTLPQKLLSFERRVLSKDRSKGYYFKSKWLCKCHLLASFILTLCAVQSIPLCLHATQCQSKTSAAGCQCRPQSRLIHAGLQTLSSLSGRPSLE